MTSTSNYFDYAGEHIAYAWVDPLERITETDESNNLRAMTIQVAQSAKGDRYEPDNMCAQAHELPYDGPPQTHNFVPIASADNDVDWVKAYVNAGITYAFHAIGIDEGARPYFSCAGYACNEVTCVDAATDTWHLPARQSGWYHLQLQQKRGTMQYDPSMTEYVIALHAEISADQPYAMVLYPPSAVKGQDEAIEIIGKNFVTATQATLCPYQDDGCSQTDCVTLTSFRVNDREISQFVDSTDRLFAAIPSDLPLASYCLTVRNPTGKQSTLPDAFTLLAGSVDCKHLAGLYGVTEAACERLRTQEHLVVDQVAYDSLGYAYEVHQFSGLDVVVTSDAMLHLFHCTFDNLLKTIEKTSLYDELLALVQGLQVESAQTYDATELDSCCSAVDARDAQTMTHAAARHNLVVFSVARKLLEEDAFEPPDAVRAAVLTYTQRVMEHRRVEFYPGDDYTQYEPRGHYAGDPQLERYFRTVMWLSRRIFRVEDKCYPEQADVELAAAVLMARHLRTVPPLMAHWQRVYDVTRLLAGPADSITPLMVNQAVDEVTGGTVVLPWLEDAEVRAKLRDELLESDAYPTSEVIPVPTLPQCPLSPRYVQVIGARYLPDAEVMQETIDPHVAYRTLPQGLDVMAALLASEKADDLLAAEKATYPALGGQLAMLQMQFESYPERWWTRSVYNGWLYVLKPLVTPVPADVPLFMQTEAWKRKSLHTALASWSQLRHDMILYGKQPYGSFTGGPSGGYGYVEPVPTFYRRLRSLCLQTQQALQQYDMLPDTYRTILSNMVEKLATYETYAVKIRDGQPLTWEECP